MARHIPAPSSIEAAGNLPKRIEEFIGRVNTGTDRISIARMTSPPGWEEPAQIPEFDEFTRMPAAVHCSTACECASRTRVPCPL